MTEVAHTGTPILYLGFSLLVVVFLVLDFVLLKAKGQHKVPVGEALAWAVVWFVAAMVFAGWYWWFVDGVHGREVANAKTIEYVTGYHSRRKPRHSRGCRRRHAVGIHRVGGAGIAGGGGTLC